MSIMLAQIRVNIIGQIKLLHILFLRTWRGGMSFIRVDGVSIVYSFTPLESLFNTIYCNKDMNNSGDGCSSDCTI